MADTSKLREALQSAPRRLLGFAGLWLVYTSLVFGALALGDALSPTFRACRNYVTPREPDGYAIPGPFETWKRPPRPPDPWGTPWIEVGRTLVRSCGPNRRDEQGGGDDITLFGGAETPAYPWVYAFCLPLREWWKLCLLLALGHFVRDLAQSAHAKARLATSAYAALLISIGYWLFLDDRLWIQVVALSGWVSPAPGQISSLLDWECSQPNHLLPLLGVGRARAPFVVGCSACLTLFLWLEGLALLVAWRERRCVEAA